jgi:hypothetical protein
MDLPIMREQVLSEMAHIPTWPRPQQSYLRANYWLVRMNSLGRKAEKSGMTASEVMEDCISVLREKHPEFEFAYDKSFFKPTKKGKVK